MKKLTLNLDELAVDSFVTSLAARDEGTVRGHDWAWSDESVCPTVTDAAGNGCRPPR